MNLANFRTSLYRRESGTSRTSRRSMNNLREINCPKQAVSKFSCYLFQSPTTFSVNRSHTYLLVLSWCFLLFSGFRNHHLIYHISLEVSKAIWLRFLGVVILLLSDSALHEYMGLVSNTT
ncbi:hypothetical protein H2248_012240 [Termitomyces sp. 'cryptogamus']|nr:hypothetical protein H2248_012240 [Termitomyces sp. 'cryptogamus']